MNYAVDRAAIVKAVFFGHAVAATSPIDPGVYFHTDKYGYAFNLEKAKSLMKAIQEPERVQGHPADRLGRLDRKRDGGRHAERAEADRDRHETAGARLDHAVRAPDEEAVPDGLELRDERQPRPELEHALLLRLRRRCRLGVHRLEGPGRRRAVTGGHRRRSIVTQRAKLIDQWQKIVMAKAPFMWLINPTNRFAYRDKVHDFCLQNTAHWPLWVVWKS